MCELLSKAGMLPGSDMHMLDNGEINFIVATERLKVITCVTNSNRVNLVVGMSVLVPQEPKNCSLKLKCSLLLG